MSEQEKHATIKVHGYFEKGLNVSTDGDFTIKVKVNSKNVDLNKYVGMMKDGVTVTLESDQTELPMDDDEDKPADGQLKLV